MGIIDQVATMPLAEKRELAEALRRAIAEDLAARYRLEPDRCPRCGCPAFVRKGSDSSGQRWLCRGCGRTFGAKTLSLLGRSKLPASAWMEFAACMADALPLRETARRVGTSLYTAWFMRMRVCEVMGRRLLPLRGESFEVDGTYLHESLPGDHSRSGWFQLGREPHRTGHEADKGTCVLCGASELGDCFCEIIDGAEDSASVMVVLGARLPASCGVVTDGWKAYNARTLEGRPHEVRGSKELEMVNSLHSRLKSFVGRFNGVSNRRLQRYLDWFCWREQFRFSARDRRELLYGHEAAGRYVCTRQLTHLESRPFMSCANRWTIGERYGYMSMVV
ncbi:IS1595 family transposase [Arabiibacter massiliensis]|uniref:IS1595 family transposase n=1 Tax=Arabiibacter massiliensis TaxID=1870985 RepID=UPI0009BC5DC1|nr:IS1595 family transposase [Arabiibacter massiliensis]